MVGDDLFLASVDSNSTDPMRSAVWEDAGLWTDLYHPDAAFIAWKAKRNPVVTFDVLVRQAPYGGAYLVAAGIIAALRFIKGFHYAPQSLELLRTLGYASDFLEELATLRFHGEVAAVQEGRLVFPGEPLLRVTAPFREALLLESGVLQAVNTATLLATKAARIVQAAAGRPVAEFGYRRAQSPLVASYAARLGGCASTSFLAAASAFSTPASGTIPHALVELFDDEEEAFRAVARTHERFQLLLDTYDTVRGAETAVRVGCWARETLGHELTGVRLDSGDLEALSRQVRAILDQGGCHATKILASGDLDEWKIADLVAHAAPIDAFGVGTALVDGLGSLEQQVVGGAIGGVYKLAWVAAENEHQSHAALKRAGAKTTLPGIKTVARADDGSSDLLLLEEEPLPDGFAPVLLPALTAETLSASFAHQTLQETLAAATARLQHDLAALPASWRALTPATPYPVAITSRLQQVRDQALKAIAARESRDERY